MAAFDCLDKGKVNSRLRGISDVRLEGVAEVQTWTAHSMAEPELEEDGSVCYRNACKHNEIR